jgi:hypothetical protein
VANRRGEIPLRVSVDDRSCEAHSSYWWTGGGMVLTLSTVLPDRGLAVELLSTYVGHPDTHTIATHLMLGPVDHTPEIHATEHADLNPVQSARECVYDHADKLIKALAARGHLAGVQIDEPSFADLERVE